MIQIDSIFWHSILKIDKIALYHSRERQEKLEREKHELERQKERERQQQEALRKQRELVSQTTIY